MHLVLATFVDHTVLVRRKNILDCHSHIDQKIETGNRRGTSTRSDNFHLFHLLADDMQTVVDR